MCCSTRRLNSASKEMICRRIRQGCIISSVPFNQSHQQQHKQRHSVFVGW